MDDVQDMTQFEDQFSTEEQRRNRVALAADEKYAAASEFLAATTEYLMCDLPEFAMYVAAGDRAAAAVWRTFGRSVLRIRAAVDWADVHADDEQTPTFFQARNAVMGPADRAERDYLRACVVFAADDFHRDRLEHLAAEHDFEAGAELLAKAAAYDKAEAAWITAWRAEA